MPQLTAERLRELLNYDPLIGTFTRRVGIRGHSQGSIAGTPLKQGHIKLQVDGVQFYAHRLAFVWMTGIWPINVVDHIDTDASNNAWLNLRDVTHSVNMQNQRSATSRSRSGLLGVCWNKRRGLWVAQIGINGGSKLIGYFDDKHKAYGAYVQEKRLIHAGCTL